MLSDFPKIHCPFVRKEYNVNKKDWKRYGSSMQLRSPKVYLVIPEINPGYEWVLEDKKTFAVEKLDGTNIKIETKNGRLIKMQNRKNIIDPLYIMGGRSHLIEGLFISIQKKYIEKNGIQAGELIGPKLQGNPYDLNQHLFYPFEKSIKHLKYRSFHEHDRTFDNWNLWFKDYLISRFASKLGKKRIMAEGVIFYNLKRRDNKQTYMAKLRRNMFPWFYENKIRIIGYPDNPIC